MKTAALVWFRLDLRLADNPALRAAIERGAQVVPVFIWAPDEEAPWEPGSASRWWLHQSLRALDADLRKLGSRLVVRRGPTLRALRTLVKETAADAVFWNRRYEPAIIARDAKLLDVLRSEGLTIETFNSALLHEPWTIANQSRKPFQVFTPFWRRCLTEPEPQPPLARPRRLRAPTHWPQSLPLEALKLEPRLDWAEGMRSAWQPGESGAQAALAEFLAAPLLRYDEDRNRPDLSGTSGLSPHLHFGETSPRQVWHAMKEYAESHGIPSRTWHDWQFLTELGWREFAHHLLFHFPHTPDKPLRAEFARFPWRQNPECLRAWQRGRTGYPLVDAGMRQLWATGWMHNRVRMVVASFLVKDLAISWAEGARWFWDTLVDADLANNTLGWQWAAGCGADAAPYFRIFNPVTQGQHFDPQGAYIRRWVRELERRGRPGPSWPRAAASRFHRATRNLSSAMPSPAKSLSRLMRRFGRQFDDCW